MMVDPSTNDDDATNSEKRRRNSLRPFSLCFLFCSLLLLSLLTSGYNNSLRTETVQQSSIIEITDSTATSGGNLTDSHLVIPPIEELIGPDDEIIGDISWMLDFAVIAFPKSGTTFMKNYLNQTDETWIYETELCIKHWRDLPNFVRIFHDAHVKLKQPPRYQDENEMTYTQLMQHHQQQQQRRIKFGLKCPGVLYRKHDLEIYNEYFPNAKLMIGVRHPVSWFESFYNYQSYRNVSMPPTSQLVGRCGPMTDAKVCTDRARFHAALARLGKTNMDSEEELSLIFGTRYEDQNFQQNETLGERERLNSRELKAKKGKTSNHHKGKKHPQYNGLENKIFLYEVRQITEEAAPECPSIIRQYLDIQEDSFPDLVRFTQNKTRAINICDKEHDGVRRLLVEHGIDAANWIRNYFVKSPDVTVALPSSFFDFLEDWSDDPCSKV